MLFAHPSMKTTEYVWINLCLCSSKTGGRRISACRPGGFLSLVLRHERSRQRHWDEPVPHPHGCSVQHAGFLFFDISHLCACSPPPTLIPHSVATTFPAGCSHHPVSFPTCLPLPTFPHTLQPLSLSQSFFSPTAIPLPTKFSSLSTSSCIFFHPLST